MIYQENFPFHNKPKQGKGLGGILRFMLTLVIIGALLFGGYILANYLYQTGQSSVDIKKLPVHKALATPYKTRIEEDVTNKEVKFLEKTIYDNIDEANKEKPEIIKVTEEPEEPMLKISHGLNIHTGNNPEIEDIDINNVARRVDFTKPKPKYASKPSTAASSKKTATGKPKRIVVNESKGSYYVVLSKVNSYKEATIAWEDINAAVKSILSPKRAMVSPSPSGTYTVEAGPFKSINDAKGKCRLIKKHSNYCKVINKL